MNERTYVAFGDSITVGAKASAPERRWVDVFVAQVHLLTPVRLRVVNAGLGDNTISPRTTSFAHAAKPSALERLEHDVVAHLPDLVTVAFGLNDMRFGTPVEVFAGELEGLLLALTAACPQAIVLCLDVVHMTGFGSFPPRDRGSREASRAYSAAISEVTRRHELPLVRVAEAMNECDDLVHADGIHANDLGHRLIGNRVFEALLTRTRFPLRGA